MRGRHGESAAGCKAANGAALSEGVDLHIRISSMYNFKDYFQK
jgi:hypothetical protein